MSLSIASTLNLTPDAELITCEPAHLLYIEKRGPFMQQAPFAWKEFWGIAGTQIDKSLIINVAGLSWVDASKSGDDAYVYQAGMLLKSIPADLLPQLRRRQIAKGRYARFVLTGSYMQLAQAYPTIFAILGKSGQTIRNDFCIEKYLNDFSVTPEDQLKTEINIPIP